MTEISQSINRLKSLETDGPPRNVEHQEVLIPVIHRAGASVARIVYHAVYHTLTSARVRHP
jgi:hypothetical protein